MTILINKILKIKIKNRLMDNYFLVMIKWEKLYN